MLKDERLSEIYDWIKSYKAKHGYSPSFQEIAVGIQMTNEQVFQAMKMMEELGMVVCPRGMLQAIRLLTRQH